MSEITKNKTTTTSVPPNLTFQSKVENAGTEFEQNEILKIDTVENRQYVNARELHTQLQVGKIFAAWIKERIEKYSLIEGKDYKTCFPNQESEIHGGKNKQDYLLTVQAAKELAMIENNEQGRRIRQYLIKVEGREMKEAIKNETTMTVKEIAEALGTAESTIRNKAAELFPDVVKNGITTRLNEYQAQTIKNALVPRNLTLKSKVENTVTELEKNQTIIRAMQYLQERDAALRQENERLKLENAEMKPKVELADALTSSKGAISMAE
ncbi:AntA/AntB antirepressor, partial [Treponema phagedenis F0421]